MTRGAASAREPTIPGAPLPGAPGLSAASESALPPWSAWAPAHDVSFYRSGRHALAAAASLAGRARRPTVFLPDYICESAVQAFRRPDVDLRFYPVSLSLEPDWRWLGETVSAVPPPAVLVLVHYFGFVRFIEEARAFCARAGARLVHDAAHLLAPTFVAADSEAVVWCPHKTLPTPSVGVLCLPRNCDPPHATAAGFRGALISAGELATRRLQTVAVSRGWSWHGRWAVDAGVDADPSGLGPIVMASAVATRALARAWRGTSAAMARRHEHARLLSRLLADAPVHPIGADAGSHGTPYMLALRLAGPSDPIAARLMRRGVPASTWPDLPREVRGEPKSHEAALALRRDVLLLPVHQSLSEAQVRRMAGIVVETLGGGPS